MLLLLKAQIKGGASGDLFGTTPSTAQVRGHVRGSHFIRPYQATRHKGAPEPLPEVHVTPPKPAVVVTIKPKLVGWLGGMDEATRERVLTEMRRHEAIMQDAYNAPSQGGHGIAVGGSGHDDMMRAEVRREFNGALSRGMTPSEAAAHTKIEAKKWIETHNSRRPGDKDWKRWSGGMDAPIEEMERDFNRAVAPKPMVVVTKKHDKAA